MKPVPFDYRAPVSLEEALPLLGLECAVLAGGQSLVPLLNLRLARPELVVDVNAVAELDYIRADHGSLRIGALTRQVVLERSELVERQWPLLHKAVYEPLTKFRCESPQPLFCHWRTIVH